MMIVVLPAAIASRTSIHVISSNQTVFGVGIGFFVSAQLYVFCAQRPPPISRAAPACVGVCAAATDAASSEMQSAPFMVGSPRERPNRRDHLRDRAINVRSRRREPQEQRTSAYGTVGFVGLKTPDGLS